MDEGTPEFDLWVKKANNIVRSGVMNVDGDADIADKETSVFQRLEMNI